MVEYAWACQDYTGYLLQRGALGDQNKALTLIAESMDTAQELGMSPLAEKVSVVKARAESLPTKAPAYPDGLTEREVEVLRLVTTGKTD